jgi:hypothetical protein
MHQRVRVAMDELPVRLCSTPEDPRHPQRPVLLWEIPNRPVLSLDDDENRKVAGRVGLHDLDLRLAAAKEPRKSIHAASESSNPRTGSPPYGDMSV